MMRSQISIGLLFSYIFFTNCINGQSGSYVPVDLFIALDQSDSVVVNDFYTIAHFAQDLILGVGEVTGFYQSDEDNGLRAGVVTFGCGKQTKVRVPVTGDVDLINSKFENLIEHVDTFGKTCLEPAIQIISGWVEEAEDIQPPDRNTAIVVLTDGRFHDFDDFTDDIDHLSTYEATRLYSVGIGDGIRVEQMEYIAGGTERFFMVANADSLEKLKQMIISFVIGGISADIVLAATSEPVDFSAANLRCLGTGFAVKTVGPGLQGFTDTSDLRCEFFDSDENVIYTSVDVRTENGQKNFYCDYPGSFLSTDYQWRLISNSTVDEGGRMVIYSQSLSSRTKLCFNNPVIGADESKRCISDDDTYLSLQGESVSLLEQIQEPFSIVRCVFSSEEYGDSFFFPVQGNFVNGELRCNNPKATYIDFVKHFFVPGKNTNAVSGRITLPEGSRGLPLPVFSMVSVEVSALSANGVWISNEVIPKVSFTDLDHFDEECIFSTTLLGSTLEKCWGGMESIDFGGENSDLFLSQSSNVETETLVGCVFSSSNDIAFTSATTSSNGNLKCPFPAEFSRDTGDFKVFAALNPVEYNADRNNKAFVYISEQLEFVTSVHFCGEFSSVEDERCIGENIEVFIEVDDINVELFEEATKNEIECRFVSSANNVRYDVTPQATSATGRYSCYLDVESKPFGLVFDEILLRQSGKTFGTWSLASSSGSSRCLRFSRYINGAQIDDEQTMRTCWGAIDSKIELRGVSASILAEKYLVSKSADMVLACKLTYDSVTAQANVTLVLPPVLTSAGESSDGFYCEIPNEFFLKDKYETQISFSIVAGTSAGDIIVGTEILDAYASYGNNCFAAALTDSSGESSPFCYGNSLNVQMEGRSLERLLDLRNANQITNLRCQFDEIDTGFQIPLEIGGNSKAGCVLPYVAGLFELNDPLVKVKYDSAEFGNDQFSGELGNYRLDTCFTPENPQRFVIKEGDIRELEGFFCAGEGYEIEYSGETVASLLALVEEHDNLNLMCSFHRRDSPNEVLFTNAPLIDADQDKVICVALQWDPYLQENSQYYDLVEVRLYLESPITKMSDDFAWDLTENDESSFCFGDPDNGEPPGYDPPPALFNSRNLATSREAISCYPTCCQRDIVSTSYPGSTTTSIIANSPNKDEDAYFFRCVFVRVDGGTEESDVVFTDAGSAFCEVEGWRPWSTTGNYTSSRLEFGLREDNQVLNIFKTEIYDPPTASARCIFHYKESNYCLGQPITFEVKGWTLLSMYNLRNDGENDLYSFEPNEFSVLLTQESSTQGLSFDLNNDVITSTWERVDEKLSFFDIGHDLLFLGDDFSKGDFEVVQISNDVDRCLLAQRSLISCDTKAVESFVTNVSATGNSFQNYPLDEGVYFCRFFNSGDDVDSLTWHEASVNRETLEISCSTDIADKVSMYQILYKYNDEFHNGKTVILKEAVLDDATDDRCAGPLGGEDPNGASPLAVVLPILLILMLAAFLAYYIYSRRPSASTSGSFVLFNVGDRLEMIVPEDRIKDENKKLLLEYNIVADKAPKGAMLSSQTNFEPDAAVYWYKGTVVGKTKATSTEENEDDIEQGSPKRTDDRYIYDITLDSPNFGDLEASQKNIVDANLRRISSDFSKDDTVKAIDPDSKLAVAAVVLEILPNDHYKIDISGQDGDFKHVVVKGSQLSSLIVLEAKEGDFVTVYVEKKLPKYQRGKVVSANFVEQSYDVELVDETTGATTVKVPIDQVQLLSFEINDVVQVRESENINIWRRGVVVAVHEGNKYDILHSNESLGTESMVPVSRIRNPVFGMDQRVEVLRRDSRANTLDAAVSPDLGDWQPGIVRAIHPEGETYDVYLTRKDELATVKNVFLRAQELDEVILRIRKGVPLRSENLEPNVPDSGEGLLPVDQRFKRRNPLDYVELPNHQFDITVPSTNGLGVRFGWTNDKKVIVAGFRDMPNGDWGELEATGLIMLKDQLIQINGTDVSTYGISDISELISQSKQKGQIKLRFGRNEEFVDNYDAAEDGDVVAT